MARLTLRNVEKAFGPLRVIHGVDLDVADGDFVVFVGPSGCGKSTLLRMIAGLESVSSGEISIDGQRVNDLPAASRGLAMVFQSYALYPHMSVYQNLAFGLENMRTPRAEIEARVMQAAKLLQIDQLLARKPGQLSGGQRQRVAIGRAITRKPQIFLFDEPLSNLDAELRVQMRIELTRLHAEIGNTMIYVTHDQVEAMTMADKIVVLRAGRIEQFGTPLDLYNRPANRFVAGFIGSPRMNFLSGTLAAVGEGSTRVAVEGMGDIGIAATALARPGEAISLGIRPEHLTANLDGPIRLKVEMVEQLGGISYVHGRLPNGEALMMSEPGQSASVPGETIAVAAKGPLHLFSTGAGEASLLAPVPTLQQEAV